MTRREYLVGVTCSLDVPRSHFIIYKSNLGTRGRKAFDDEIHDLINIRTQITKRTSSCDRDSNVFVTHGDSRGRKRWGGEGRGENKALRGSLKR